MSCNKTFPSIIQKDIDNCLVSLEICDEIMTCCCCCYFLEQHKKLVVDEILDSIDDIPNKITRIKVPLYPLPDNRFYYSFDGLSTIVYNLLKTENAKHKSSVEKHTAFLKIYYEKNSLFNLPVIQIEVLFFGKLKSKAIDEYWKTLKAEVLFFTGSVGDIDIIDVEGVNHLQELFRIPLLFGYPEFKYEGALKDYKFSLENIKEMNYLHSMQLLPLEMSKVINNNTLELFAPQKEAIQNEKIKENDNSDGLDSLDIIRAIWGSDSDYPQEQSEEDFENLPF
jgi:hypothetical protein